MVDPSEQDAQTTGDHLIIVLVVVVFAVTTSLLAVGLRIWCRMKIRALGWDDFAAVMTCLCIVGYGSGILALIPLGLSDPSGMLPFHKISNFYKCSYFILFLYSQALFFAKMAFVLLYYRVVSLSYWRWTYIAAITFLVLWDVSGILYHFLQCTPMSTIWDPAVVGKCVPHQMEVGYVLSGINIFTDFVVAILPLPVIWKLNLRRSQKIALSGIFLLACFSIVLSIIRVTWVNMWSISTWKIVRPQLWGLAEATSALICACVPTYKPLLVRLNAKMPRCPKNEARNNVRQQRGDDEMGLNMDATRVASQGQDSFSEGSQRTLRAPSYGTNTYITAVQDPWKK